MSNDLKANYKALLLRGLFTAVALAVLSVVEYIIAGEIDNPTWWMVPFMVLKGWLILQVFMHIADLRKQGAH